MKAWKQMTLAAILTTASCGCELVRPIDQWKCDNFGFCINGAVPSANSRIRPHGACNTCRPAVIGSPVVTQPGIVAQPGVMMQPGVVAQPGVVTQPSMMTQPGTLQLGPTPTPVLP